MRTRLKELRRLVFRYPPLVLEPFDYDKYWRERRGDNLGFVNEFQRKRAEWILPRIQEGAAVLDIGCGDGVLLTQLMQRKNITPYGADISEMALAHAAAKGIKTLKFDANDHSAPASLPPVDYIVLFEVLEHMADPERFLKAVAQKASRSVFLSVPNTGYFPYRLRLLMGRTVMQWRTHPGEHLRFWTLADLRWWLDQLGYRGRADLETYEGLPVLNRIWGSVFAMGLIGEIRLAG